jgi:hypothetical protein
MTKYDAKHAEQDKELVKDRDAEPEAKQKELKKAKQSKRNAMERERKKGKQARAKHDTQEHAEEGVSPVDEVDYFEKFVGSGADNQSDGELA